MVKPGGKTYNQNADSETAMIMVIVCIVSIILFAVILWMRFHIGISASTVFVRNIWNWPFYQIYITASSTFGMELGWMRELLSSTTKLCVPESTVNPFTKCLRDPANIKFGQLSYASLTWNIIFSGWALLIAFFGYVRISEQHPKVKFGKKHTLESFMNEQKQNEPHLRVYTDFNLQLVNQNEGPLMGMKTPREFAKEYGLAESITDREIQFISNGVTRSQKDTLEKVPTVNREKLINICRKQLGALWVGIDHITDAEAILLAMYLPRACSTDRNMHDDDFNKVWNNCLKLEKEFWEIAEQDILWSDKFKPIGYYPDDSCIYPDGKKSLAAYKIEKLKRDFIEPYIDHPVTLSLLDKHAYTRTFIIDVVFNARRLGVMAPCQMRWLKFYDREIWALLQNIGRPSIYSENLGAISHYEAETVAGCKIYLPHFDVAIRGFEFELQTYLYSDDALRNLGAVKKNLDEPEQTPVKL